ncbi:MAG TPA: hypothetical protein VF163_08325 [Micromonosporaceae bacterium]
MTAPDNDDIDRQLTEAGQRWRASQPAPPRPDLRRLVGEPPAGAVRLRRWAPMAAVAGVAAVVAAILVPLALHRAADPIGPGGPVAGGPAGDGPAAGAAVAGVDAYSLPADEGSGVPVRGTGTLFRAGQGQVRLCAEVVGTMDLPQSAAGCSPVAVPTTGVNPGLLVHTTTGGQAYSDRVEVEGRYHGGVLAVSRVAPAPAPSASQYQEPAIPCPGPAGGWPLGRGLPPGDDSAIINHFVEYVRAHPDRFLDLWEGHPDGTPSADASYAPTRMVFVVGTTGDVTKARAELAAIYPGNLCVHQVRANAADLDRIVTRLRDQRTIPIEANPDVVSGLVQVRVVALDPSTLAVLDAAGRDALAIQEPLLRPVR